MLVSLHRSAFKHGLAAEDIEYAWTSGVARQLRLDDDEPERVLRLGVDRSGRPIELVALVFDQRRALIVHTMRARKSTLDAIEGRGPHE